MTESDNIENTPLNVPSIALILFLFIIFIGIRIGAAYIMVPVGYSWFLSAALVSPFLTFLNITIVYQLSRYRWALGCAVIVFLITGALFGLVLKKQTSISNIEDNYQQIVQSAKEDFAIRQLTSYLLVQYSSDLPFVVGELPAAALAALPPTLQPPPIENEKLNLFLDSANKTILLLLLTAGGALLSKVIREKNLLAPLAPVAAVVDVITVLTPIGFTKRVMEQMPNIIPMVSETFPILHTRAQSASPIGQPFSLIGPGDILFLAFYFICLNKFAMRVKKTYFYICLALILYLEIVLNLGDKIFLGVSLQALPALVPMGIVVLAVNWREFQLSRSEKMMTAVVWIAALLVMTAAFFMKKPAV